MTEHKTHPRRKKPRIRRRTKPGAVPGSFKVHPEAQPCVVRIIGFGPDGFAEDEKANLDTIPQHLSKWPVTWIDVSGLGNAETIHRLGALFDLHPLALEDVVNVHQRAKVEAYNDQLFIVVRTATEHPHVDSKQISIFVGERFVLTFCESQADCFEAIRQRIRLAGGRIRSAGPDYLSYALIDSAIDGYFPIVDQYADTLEALEDDIISEPRPADIAKIHDLRSELLLLRRCVRPHREAINTLIRDDHPAISDETRVYLRDSSDHVTQLIDLLDTYREVCSDLRDFYLSTVSNRMNETMQVLTVIATIFIPLTFITGLYGMNFDRSFPWNMPELGWTFGYAWSLVLMAVIAGGLLWFSKRRGWLGQDDTRRSDRPPRD